MTLMAKQMRKMHRNMLGMLNPGKMQMPNISKKQIMM